MGKCKFSAFYIVSPRVAIELNNLNNLNLTNYSEQKYFLVSMLTDNLMIRFVIISQTEKTVP